MDFPADTNTEPTIRSSSKNDMENRFHSFPEYTQLVDVVDAVYGSFMRSDSGNVEHFAETMNLVNPDSICLTGGFPGGVHSYIFRRETLLASGGFRTEQIMFEDIELILRLITDGAWVIGSNIPGFHHHYIPTSLTRGCARGKRLRIERKFLDIATKDQLMSRLEIFRRHLLNRTKYLFYVLKLR